MNTDILLAELASLLARLNNEHRFQDGETIARAIAAIKAPASQYVGD